MKKMLATVLAAALCPLASLAGYDPIPDAEEQVALLVSEREVWEPAAVPGVGTVGFLVSDLNHNGRLEVLVSDFGGPDIPPHMEAYEVNENRTATVQISKVWGEGEPKAGRSSKKSMRIYKEGISGTDGDVLAGAHRDGREHRYDLSTPSLQDGRSVMWPLAKSSADDSGEGGKHTTYQNGDGDVIFEKELPSTEGWLLIPYERADLPFAWLTYHADTYEDDWLSADDETIEERLLDSYRAFADAETEEEEEDERERRKQKGSSEE